MIVPEGQSLPLFFFFKLLFPGQNPNFLALDQLQMFLIFRQTLHVFKPVRVTSTVKGHATVTSSSVTWRHLKRCSFQRFISTEKINRDQAKYLHVFKPRCVFKPGCVTSTIWRQVTVTSSSVISTEQNNYRNIYRKNKCTIKLKPCMYSCRDVLHPKYGILKTLNRLLFNKNDKQFQCRCALLHNHTIFMCKSNHTDECKHNHIWSCVNDNNTLWSVSFKYQMSC